MSAAAPRPIQQIAVPAVPAPHLVNLANGLTTARLLLVPVFGVVLLHDDGTRSNWRLAAFAVFALACFTDRIDGQVARRRGEVTDVGKVADPIADKALTGMALVGLSALELLPWWVTALVLLREVGVTALRFWVIRHGVIAASRGGKAKTLLQGIAIALYVLPLPASVDLLRAVVMALAVVVTVVTGVDYVLRARRLRRGSARAASASAASERAASAAPR